MISSLNPSAELFLADLSMVQSQINTAESQVSSGLKISKPSDAPDQLGSLMQIHAELDQNAQVSTNLSVVKTETDTAESALQTATQLLDQATSLASQGANTIQTASDRKALAQQVTNILQQMVGLSQSAVNGRFIFSGDEPQQPSYQLNLGSPNGVDRLITPTATRQIVDATGISFNVGHTAQDIFDHRNPDDSLAPDNVFAAINSLLVGLHDNNQAGGTNSIASLHQAATYLSTELSFYGSVQNRIAGATSFASSQQVQLQTSLSQTQDADITRAALQLTQSTTQMNAALSAEAKLPRTSLFDFLA